MKSGSSFVSIVSAEGSRQGCVLGSLLFCLGLQPVLERAILDLKVTILAIVDDITLIGPADDVAFAFARINSSLPALGLQLSGPKCAALLPTRFIPPSIAALARDHKVDVLHGAMPLLGSMIGNDTKAISTFAEAKAERHAPFFQALQSPLLHTQHAMLLLRASAIPRMNFLCRTLAPFLIASACTLFDQRSGQPPFPSSS